MFKRYFVSLSLILFLYSIVICVGAEQSANKSNKSNQELFQYVKENKNRVGFEIFYKITNLFIDNSFIPTIPEEIFEMIFLKNETLMEKLNSLKEALKLEDGLPAYIKLSLKVYPSLVGFLIVCLIFAFFIPCMGLFFCFYRCCCRSKLDPHDRKIDSLLRKLNAFFIFVILLFILLATIILFFTNQNGSYAIEKTPDLINTKLNELNEFNVVKMPQFFDSLTKNLEFLRNDTFNLIKSSTKELENMFNKKLIENIQVIESEINNIMNLTQLFDLSNELSSNSTLNDINSLKNLANTQEQSQMINLFIQQLLQIKSQLSIMNTTNLINDNTFNLEINESAQKVSSLLNNEISKSINDVLVSFSVSIPYLSNILNVTFSGFVAEMVTPTVPLVKNLSNYYNYFYVFLVGVCSLMLLLFILYSCGLAGICARRTHYNSKQRCHRGLSANLLMSGVGIYLIFSWILIIISVGLYLPGITTRHFVCKPAIELEDSNLFQAIKNLDSTKTLNKINFKGLFSDCNKNENSTEMCNLIFNYLNISLDTNNQLLMATNQLKSIQLQMPEIKEIIGSYIKKFSTNVLELKNVDIQKSNLFFTNLLNVANQGSDVKIKGTILKILQFLNLFQERFQIEKNILTQVQEYNDNKNYDIIKENVKNELIAELVKYFQGSFLQDITSKTITTFQQSMPSCKILSELYKGFVTTGCFEYLDNFNTFWLTLLFSLLLHLFLVFFAVKQADLFRKHFPYDEISEEITLEDSKDLHYYQNRANSQRDVFHTKSSLVTNVNAPIDAYEMGGYSNNQHINKTSYKVNPGNGNNNIRKGNNRSPPPEYPDYRFTRT